MVPLSSVRCPLSAVRCPLSPALCPLPAALCPLPSVRRIRSTMCALPLGVTPRDMAVVQELRGVFAALSMMQVS